MSTINASLFHQTKPTLIAKLQFWSNVLNDELKSNNPDDSQVSYCIERLNVNYDKLKKLTKQK